MADQPRFERDCEQQAAGNAGNDRRNIDPAEAHPDVEQVCGGGALLQRESKFLAVIDQFAQHAEQTLRPAGFVRA